MSGFPSPQEPSAAKIEQKLAELDVDEQHLAEEPQNGALQKHHMGLIEGCRARLPGVDIPAR